MLTFHHRLQHYLEYPHCRHIILGCSHDTGYETFLQKFAADERDRKKMTMLDGPVMNVPFRSLGFSKRVALWSVFASQPAHRSQGSLSATPGTANASATPGSSASPAATGSTQSPNTPRQGPGQQPGNQRQPNPNGPSGHQRRPSQRQRQAQQSQQQQSTQNQTGIIQNQMPPAAAQSATRQAAAPPAENDKPESPDQARPMSHVPETPRSGLVQQWWERLSGSDLWKV